MMEVEVDSRDSARVGQTIGGKYQLVRVIGSGGMGAVYEAENTWTKRRVAIKVLRPEVADNKEAVQRFMQEAQSAAQIAHPNIVDVLDMGADPADGSLFLVQELLTGCDLRQRLDDSPRVGASEALAIVLPIMDALAVAHRRGIVHRDIKPENIFLTQDPNGEMVPKLIDFGVSKMKREENSLHVTQTGVAVGTPYYMSPEQARGTVAVDGRSDVWSLGAVLFEMLAGRVPFEAPNYNVLMVKILTEAPVRIELLAPDVPPDVAAVVHGALTPDREKRFQTMEDFRDAALACAAAADYAFSRRASTTGRFRLGPGGMPVPVPPVAAPTAPRPVHVPSATAPRASMPGPVVAAAAPAQSPPGYGARPHETPMRWSGPESLAAPPAKPAASSARMIGLVAVGVVVVLVAGVAGVAVGLRGREPARPTAAAAAAPFAVAQAGSVAQPGLQAPAALHAGQPVQPAQGGHAAQPAQAVQQGSPEQQHAAPQQQPAQQGVVAPTRQPQGVAPAHAGEEQGGSTQRRNRATRRRTTGGGTQQRRNVLRPVVGGY